jgi:isoleucyl-tRNA synthetase
VLAETGPGFTAVLDTAIDEALRKEGLARELVNRIQNLRKQADLDVSQRIDVVIACDGPLAEVATDPELLELIRAETLASTLEHRPRGPGRPARPGPRDPRRDRRRRTRARPRTLP